MSESHTESTVNAIASLPHGDGWIQAIIELIDNHRELRYAHVNAGDDLPIPPELTWEYEQFVFIATRVEMAKLANALSTKEICTIAIGPHDVTIPIIQQSTQLTQRPGFELHDPENRGFPSTEYAFHQTQQRTMAAQRYLIGTNSPSFRDLTSAYKAFFLDDYETPATAQIPGELLTIRVTRTKAGIGSVHVSPTALSVDVFGTDLENVNLELFSPHGVQELVIDKQGKFSFPLTDGISSSNTWLWLKRDNTWLDYRSLSFPWATPEQLRAAEIYFEPTVTEQNTGVEALIAGGEGPTVEFKSELPDGKSSSMNPFKTIAAFANGVGGVIVFGVDKDETTIVGLGNTDPNNARDRLGQMIRSRVIPTPEFQASTHTINGKCLLLLKVEVGPSPPYGVIANASERERPQYFVRNGASTFPALPHDLATLMRRVISQQ